ncbi:MAG TPA: aminoacyl-tRNA hydrolase [Bauldia sp.]|nr:aminoacyl-tRNA hydrolase [Bauldia sp.]
MLLIVGLGNPGPEYARQRHNIGFIAVDAIHRRHGFPPWRRRFSGEVAEGALAGEKVLLLKPLTYMNESGRSVEAARAFYKLEPKDILVIHDEVDLPPGKTRMKLGGGAAGHNGLRSVTAAIGDGYRRLRIGVGHPGVKEAVPHYVLHDFAKGEAEWAVPLIDAIAENAPLLAEGKDNTFANRLHAATAAEAADAEEAKPAAKREPVAKKTEPDKPAGREGPLAGKLRKLFGL